MVNDLELEVKKQAMQEAYDYGFSITGAIMVYNSLRQVAIENHAKLSDSISSRVNDIIKVLMGAETSSPAIQKCIEVDEECFDALYDAHVLRDLYAERIINIILANPLVKNPEDYVALLKQSLAKSTTQAADNTVQTADSDVTYAVSLADLRNTVYNLASYDIAACKSSDELYDLLSHAIKERGCLKAINSF